ncbi:MULTISPECIES: ABC transporter substrate-binding protein [unclassified Streptomyces]|uniref:ABC transporter substrate-binding protein n=1 Tax=unclassified Streptomyces TaxID=2593676 RepID=UPI0037B81B75
MRLTRGLLAAATLLPLALTGCAPSSAGGSADSGELRYWMWDANQMPAYQECAKKFEKANPGITITFEQKGYKDYWTALTTAFVSGDAPDVFVNHLTKYGEYVRTGQIEPLDERVKRDKVDTGAYIPGLAELWVGPDKKRYGLPKDWDTIALFYNKEVAKKAGVTDKDLAEMAWNPQGGGTFEEIAAKLTVDKNGVRGDQPGFDPKNVKTYGFGYGDNGADDSGQDQWSWMAAGNGWTYTDKNPWGTSYNYDDPEFVETITYFRDLIAKGYAPPLKVATGGVKPPEQFGAGNYAMSPDGDWAISTFDEMSGVDAGIAPLPAGPTGKRASMFNGLADSIWSGSKKKDAAWKWVTYLAGAECQKTVGSHGVVFPALPEATEVAEKAFAERGIDVAPFTRHVDDGTTFQPPITDKASDITSVLSPALDRILMGQGDPAEELKAANDKINGLLE